MRLALGLARRGLGRTWPNPAVGCVLVRDGRIVGRGLTQPGGRPHAETIALAGAGAAAAGATAYVSLEPCSHHGRTPPCADALVKAGVRRVVIALEDPDPRVRGGGRAVLQKAGIAVEEGLLVDEAREVNAGFMMRVQSGRPLVALKTASSLDGRIATGAGESRWITGQPARDFGHLLRARHDAVMVGIGTALADDPELTCRLPGLVARQPVRIVLDSQARLPLRSRLVRTAGAGPVWLLHGPGAQPRHLEALRQAGIECLGLPAASDGRVDLMAAMRELGARGLTSLLAEGGGALAAGLARYGLIDRLHWFRAGILLGGDGLPAVGPFGLSELARAPGFRCVSRRRLGEDMLESWYRAG
ncbi:MAG: bifunctional diaminohydroxyphosphoribosylaminopyrimidine deaminase/5-amino-6-(5-phosphoribosylamino)uracil reductase RibD [Alphaproteobacteria bacterium]|nr:bifunctional diaminohydroxyphosphoribosylaminopyrimidine deaminase/5-amino-6-(5-phosphoribosylamino)uracil reductase RibD [Alphaproteobacteria bacterium]